MDMPLSHRYAAKRVFSVSGLVAVVSAAMVFAGCPPKTPPPTAIITSSATTLGSGDTATITVTLSATYTIASVALTVNQGGTVTPATVDMAGTTTGTATFTAANVTQDTVATVGGTFTYRTGAGNATGTVTPVSITVHPKATLDVSTASISGGGAAIEPPGTTVCSVTSTAQGPAAWKYAVACTTTTAGLGINGINVDYLAGDVVTTSSTGSVTKQLATPSGGTMAVIDTSVASPLTLTITATRKKATNAAGGASFDITMSDKRRFTVTTVGPK
jgi:hypothetical protein